MVDKRLGIGFEVANFSPGLLTFADLHSQLDSPSLPTPFLHSQRVALSHSEPQRLLTLSSQSVDFQLQQSLLTLSSQSVDFQRADSQVSRLRNRMKQHLQAAVALELKTIPLYLYAAYSIMEDGLARWSIMDVVKQEMLHLALAGNLLCSIGGIPILYYYDRARPDDTYRFMPRYPDHMFYQDITLNLTSAKKSTLATFMELERPEPGLTVDEAGLSDRGIYGTVGDFYKAIGQELIHWNASSDDVFLPDRIKPQFTLTDGSWYDGRIGAVSDIKSALSAIKTIIDQGEGSTRTPRAPMPPPTGRIWEPTPPPGVKSHFEVFRDLQSGPQLRVRNFKANPRTADVGDANLKTILVAADAAYCYLLISIENVWNGKIADDRRSQIITNNVRKIMSDVLRPLATFLGGISYEESGTQYQVAPFFNFYRFTDKDNCHSELQGAVGRAVTAAANARYPNFPNSIEGVVRNLVPISAFHWE